MHKFVGVLDNPQNSRVRHQYGIFGGKSQKSFSRNATRAGREEGRLFSQVRKDLSTGWRGLCLSSSCCGVSLSVYFPVGSSYILTEVVSTDRMQSPKSRFFHTDRLSSVNKGAITRKSILSTALLHFCTRAHNTALSAWVLHRWSNIFGSCVAKFRRAETVSGGSLSPPKKRSVFWNLRYSRSQSLRSGLTTTLKAVESKISRCGPHVLYFSQETRCCRRIVATFACGTMPQICQSTCGRKKL